MCNNCDCDGIDRCSIVGYQSYGACCSMCASFDEEHTCLNYETVAKMLTISKSEIFKVASKEKDRELEVLIENFP